MLCDFYPSCSVRPFQAGVPQRIDTQTQLHLNIRTPPLVHSFSSSALHQVAMEGDFLCCHDNMGSFWSSIMTEDLSRRYLGDVCGTGEK